MRTPTRIEGIIFLVINLIAPILFGLMLSAVHMRIAFYASILAFLLLQFLNFLRIRKGANLKRCYFAIILANSMTFIAIGNVALLSSVLDIWRIVTNWL